MKLIDKQNPAEPFDIPRGLAEYLFESSNGRFEKWTPAPSLPLVAATTWTVGTCDNRPHIHGVCASCKGKHTIFGTGKTSRFYHCGIQEEVPEHIVQRAEEIQRSLNARGVRHESVLEQAIRIGL